MGVLLNVSSSKTEHRKRLIALMEQIKVESSPQGWQHVATIGVGGLHAVGFSRLGPYLLVVSSAGRGVIHCTTGEKVERDYEEGAGLDASGLHCQGLGVIADEVVSLAGLYGGGLPWTNSAGESLELISPEWPESRLILAGPFKSPYEVGHQEDCAVIYSGYVTAFGFSWCGNYIAAACSSDVDIWRRASPLEACLE